MELELVYKMRNYRTERNGTDYIISEEYDGINNQADITVIEEDTGKNITDTEIGERIKQDYFKKSNIYGR